MEALVSENQVHVKASSNGDGRRQSLGSGPWRPMKSYSGAD